MKSQSRRNFLTNAINGLAGIGLASVVKKAIAEDAEEQYPIYQLLSKDEQTIMVPLNKGSKTKISVETEDGGYKFDNYHGNLPEPKPSFEKVGKVAEIVEKYGKVKETSKWKKLWHVKQLKCRIKDKEYTFELFNVNESFKFKSGPDYFSGASSAPIFGTEKTYDGLRIVKKSKKGRSLFVDNGLNGVEGVNFFDKDGKEISLREKSIENIRKEYIACLDTLIKQYTITKI